MTYTIRRGADMTTERAIVFRHTVHNGDTATPLTVVMLDVKRASEDDYRRVGQKALDTLAILRPELKDAIGATDALAFGKRYAGTVNELTMHLTHCIDPDTGSGPVTVSYAHTRGSGAWEGTADIIDRRGFAILLPALPTN